MIRVLSAGIVAAVAGASAHNAAAQETLEVVASIKPVASLVAGVMAGVGTPRVIVAGAQSPHTYAMRPSDAAALQSADAVFWIGEDMETFLTRPLAALAGDAAVVELSATPGLIRLGFREGGAFVAHGHGDDDHGGDADHLEDGDEAAHRDDHGHDDPGHDDGAAEIDQHFWLDPANAARMVAQIAATLGALDPARADRYARNADLLTDRLDSLGAEIAAELAGLDDVPYVVFHDAYQYFENRFDVHAVGSITVLPDTPPSAHRVQEIHDRIADSGAVCVFAEPQFNPRTVDLVAAATGGRAGVLDPLGAEIDAGADHYFALMREMAATMRQCLAGTS